MRVFLIDTHIHLQAYMEFIKKLLEENYYLTRQPYDYNYKFILEESVRQVIDVLDKPDTFLQQILTRPHLNKIFTNEANLNPDIKIRIEKVWKELAVNLFILITTQMKNHIDVGFNRTEIFEFILVEILNDGLIIALE